MPDFKPGQIVQLSDGRKATVRFAGQTNFQVGEWIGVELEDKSGKNDGSVQGIRYFDCPAGYGMFVKPMMATIVAQAPGTKPATRKPARPSSFHPASVKTVPSGDAALAKRRSLNAPSPSPVPKNRPIFIYRRIFHHLTPGSGYVEHVEIDWVPRWDKYTMPQASALKEWSDRFLGALDRFNRSARVDSTAVHRTIEGAGFTNFREEIIRCYVNPWMSDPHEQDVANWFNIAFSRGVDAMSFVPMIEGLGMSQSKVQDLCTRVKKEICVLAHHAYFDIHIWSARRSPD
ncbi:hypothetical protein ED733_003075 [Metarhizium rileyi]|uniref:CAP-Gly domain-containing protein n=1 Tax=Metarhizium rileyi (strain RCEF 4871) TaxID=1649241 RepID=A0A5C6G1J4_METRR|nr:hypothetical protein ED733_003075 [Metarhizium rileyi]